MAESIKWSTLHDLAYLFLGLGHGADGDLAKEEHETIVKKLLAREPTLLREGAKQLLNQAARVYIADRKARDKTRLKAVIRRLARRLDDDALSEALSDLVELARADGVILDKEWSFLDEVKRVWGVLGQ